MTSPDVWYAQRDYPTGRWCVVAANRNVGSFMTEADARAVVREHNNGGWDAGWLAGRKVGQLDARPAPQEGADRG